MNRDEKEVQIEALEMEIQRDETILAGKKFLLKELTKEPPKPFAATAIGQKLNAALAWCTQPFATWHADAHAAATNPHDYVVAKALESADSVLKKAQLVPGKNHKDARKMALRAAHTKLEIGRYANELNYSSRVEALQGALAEQVTRLRQEPPSAEAMKAAVTLLHGMEFPNAKPTS